MNVFVSVAIVMLAFGLWRFPFCAKYGDSDREKTESRSLAYVFVYVFGGELQAAMGKLISKMFLPQLKKTNRVCDNSTARVIERERERKM